MKYIFTRLLTESNIEKRCIYDVLNKSAGGDVHRAFAICRSSMQKAGNYAKGTETLTSKGKKKNKSSFDKVKNKTKIAGYNQAVKQARK
jgi:alcohol dehydrogenase class IV